MTKKKTLKKVAAKTVAKLCRFEAGLLAELEKEAVLADRSTNNYIVHLCKTCSERKKYQQ